MEISVQFYSYLRDLAGCSSAVEEVPEGCCLGDFHRQLMKRFPKLAPMEHSTLLAVGVEYQDKQYALRTGDHVSLFPPVQGG